MTIEPRRIRTPLAATISNLVASLLRHENVDLPRGAVADMVASGEVTVDQIVAQFRGELERGLGVAARVDEIAPWLAAAETLARDLDVGVARIDQRLATRYQAVERAVARSTAYTRRLYHLILMVEIVGLKTLRAALETR